MAVLPVCSAVQLGHAVGARRRLLGGDCRARARLAPSHRPHPLDRRRARGQGWHCVAEQGTDAVPSSGCGPWSTPHAAAARDARPGVRHMLGQDWLCLRPRVCNVLPSHLDRNPMEIQLRVSSGVGWMMAALRFPAPAGADGLSARRLRQGGAVAAACCSFGGHGDVSVQGGGYGT
jgi:hypothetical protein